MRNPNFIQKVLAVCSSPPTSVFFPPLIPVLVTILFGDFQSSFTTNFEVFMFMTSFFGSYLLSYYMGKYNQNTFFKQNLLPESSTSL